MIEKIEKIIKENASGNICPCGGGGTDDDNNKCQICNGTGIYEWDFNFAAREIIKLFKSKDEK